MNAAVGTIADQEMAQGVSRGGEHKREARVEVARVEIAHMEIAHGGVVTTLAHNAITVITGGLAHNATTAITEDLAHSAMTAITGGLARAGG
jgi:hypothetical protein